MKLKLIFHEYRIKIGWIRVVRCCVLNMVYMILGKTEDRGLPFIEGRVVAIYLELIGFNRFYSGPIVVRILDELLCVL